MARREVTAGEEFEMRLDLVNVATSPGVITRIECIVPAEFKVTSLPAFCSVQNGSIEVKEKVINPFQVVTIKLKLKTGKAGNYCLNPNIGYVNDLGENQTFKPEPVIIDVHLAQPTFEILPGRVTTGYLELDHLLLGGIPQNHAVALTSPSNDEREQLISRFLEAGAKAGETTFHITAEAGNAKALTEQYSSNFYLFLCNLQADAMIQNLPNVFKLKGVENLTDIDIALTKAFRPLSTSVTTSKRICLEIISDALLQHHAINTRRWLSALLPTLKSKGFTILAVVDRQMHPPEETQAVLGLFDGEISIYEKETEKGTERFLKIRRLSNQKYLKDEIRLTEE
jgi:KaiC/GvpD/RAD55 family RecA-like ATPase